MRENRKTDYRFKLLYAFAIIMVVLDHADGGGLALKTDWYLYGGLPLPLFIFCSGYFYRDADEDHAGMYIRRKAKTLLIPMYLYTIAYGLIVQLLRAKGFAMGGDLTPENILIAPLVNGHQFVYNMGGWFIAPLFMVEIYNLLVRKLLKLINPQISETVFFVIGILSGLAGNQLACMGFLAGWRLALVRMLYFVPFYSLGIFYRRILEKTDRKIPSFRLFTVIFAIKGNSFGAQAAVDGETFLTGSGTIKGSVISGDFRIIAEETNYANIKLTDFNQKEFTGTVELSLTKDAWDGVTHNSSLSPILATAALKLEFSKGKVAVDVNVASQSFVTATISKSKPEQLSFDTNVTAVDISEWSSTIDTTELVKRLTDAGAPASFIQNIFGSLIGSR